MSWTEEHWEWKIPKIDLGIPDIPFHPFTNKEDFTIFIVFIIVVLCIIISQLPKN